MPHTDQHDVLRGWRSHNALQMADRALLLTALHLAPTLKSLDLPVLLRAHADLVLQKVVQLPLTDLSISNLHLLQQDLAPESMVIGIDRIFDLLHQLPKLQILELVAIEYVAPLLSSVEGKVPSLTKLNLWSMDISDTLFRNLVHNLRNCPITERLLSDLHNLGPNALLTLRQFDGTLRHLALWHLFGNEPESVILSSYALVLSVLETLSVSGISVNWADFLAGTDFMPNLLGLNICDKDARDCVACLMLWISRQTGKAVTRSLTLSCERSGPGTQSAIRVGNIPLSLQVCANCRILRWHVVLLV